MAKKESLEKRRKLVRGIAAEGMMMVLLVT